MATHKPAGEVSKGDYVFAEDTGFWVTKVVPRGREIQLKGETKSVTLARDVLVMTKRPPNT